MTSIQFLKSIDATPHHGSLDWGTGKHPRKHIDVTLPRSATWRTSGEPTKQQYKRTELSLSNLRDNDELVPKPQAVDVGKDSINLPFPAEHPHYSHIPRFAVFPKFDSSEDPKRGVAARSQQPISSEMPANPDDDIVRKKIKGYAYRHEFEEKPTAAERKALYWPGEEFFDQPSKIHGNKVQYFPTPPKLMCPNLQDRSGGGGGGGDGDDGKSGGTASSKRAVDLHVSPRTANALRNVERAQWHTTYQMNYTGLGPSNAMELDNLEEKQERLFWTGCEDDSLHPRTLNTFDPARPIDGRLPRNVRPLPIHQPPLVTDATVYDKQYSGGRKPTLKELEDQRLLCGTEYLNLPDISGDPGRDVTWRHLDSATRAGPCLEKVEKAKAASQAQGQETPLSYSELVSPRVAPPQAPAPSSYYSPRAPPPHQGETYLAEAKKKQDDDIQEIEAHNRWRVLQSQTPHHDLTALRNKMNRLPSEDQPSTFYRHEGRYNEERAALYKTSYDPHSLSWSMNAEAEAGSELTNTLHSNIQSQYNVSLPAARLNEDVNSALKWSRTFSLAKPELSGDRRDGPEVVQTYNQAKSSQRQRLLPPPAHLASPRVQEKGELLQREATTMGRGYNVKKLLQEHCLSPRCRDDPTTLMSHENQNLERVRSRAYSRPATPRQKSVFFDPEVDVMPQAADYSASPGLDLDLTPTLTTRLQSQLMPTLDPKALPAPHLSGETRNPPPPRYAPTPASPPGYQDQNFSAETDNNAQREFNPEASSSSFKPSPMLPLRHSAPPTPGTRSTRRVHFADNNNNYYYNNDDDGDDDGGGRDDGDENNNAGNEDRNVQQSARVRYRSFPKRCPGSLHGHGLIDSEYTNAYRGPPSPRSARKKQERLCCSYNFPNLDLGPKSDDARFQWQPGQGTPRPQSTLLRIQDSFSKTEARRKFHETFPEVAPEIRWNITQGRRHEFWGYNSQIIHG